MHDPAFQLYYEKKKKEARETYNKIGRVWCPGLNDYVSFNNIGFWHLIRKGSKRRPHIHQIKRFALIIAAEQIVSGPSALISKREGLREDHPVHFWAFRGRVKNANVRVIIRQVGNSHKHFLSVFEEDKQKTTLE